MKKGIKTLAMWLIIGIIFVVAISAILENSNLKMTYSELITAIDAGEVEKVTLASDETSASIKLKGEKLEKQVNIPSLDSFISYTEEYIKTGEIELEEESE